MRPLEEATLEENSAAAFQLSAQSTPYTCSPPEASVAAWCEGWEHQAGFRAA